MPQIVLRSVTKSYRRGPTAVDNLNLEIPDGSFTAILGPSGCGKTTTLRMLAGLEQPTEGVITVGDRVFSSSKEGVFVPPNDRNLGLVFQNYALWPHLNVRRNIEFGLTIKKINRVQRGLRVHEVMDLLHIDHLADRLPSQLSGGEQQRVAVARALAPRPSLLLFDEPLSNLDAPLRLELSTELQRLHHELGMTAVLVTHDQAEAMAVATMLVVMRAGLIEQMGSPSEIYRTPSTTHVARFIGNPQMNLTTPIGALAGLAELAAIEYHVDRSTITTLGIRPEHVLVGHHDGSWNFDATVRSVILTGHSAIVRLSIDQDNEIVSLCSGDVELSVGEGAEFAIDLRRLHCFDEAGERLLNRRTTRALVNSMAVSE